MANERSLQSLTICSGIKWQRYEASDQKSSTGDVSHVVNNLLEQHPPHATPSFLKLIKTRNNSRFPTSVYNFCRSCGPKGSPSSRDQWKACLENKTPILSFFCVGESMGERKFRYKFNGLRFDLNPLNLFW